MNLERYQNVGSVIAIVVVVIGVLIALQVIPMTPVVIGCSLAGLGAARLC
jgi:hypothetical protein